MALLKGLPKVFEASGDARVRPVRPREPDEFTVATLNLFALADDIDDVGEDGPVSSIEYQHRLTKLSLLIRDVLRAPDILAVQEAEKIEVLEALAAKILAADAAVRYTAFLEPGSDRLRNSGFLVRDTVRVDTVEPRGVDATFEPDGSPATLFTRPPLVFEGAFEGTQGDRTARQRACCSLPSSPLSR